MNRISKDNTDNYVLEKMAYNVSSSSDLAYPQDQLNGYAVQIVEIEDDKPKLKEDELKMILLHPGLEYMRVMVLSIAGIFRSGKSFLLNLLIRYLSECCSESWMNDDDSILDGFKWCSGSERETTGIWMWSKVFFITGPDGGKFGVALMDTQGTQDPYSSTKENASIFALSTLLSSIQIYNVKGDVNEADLQFLQLFIRYGISVNQDNKKPFQTLLFLIRDWQNPQECKFGKDGGMKHLEKCMAICPVKQSKENQDLRKSIHGVFANIVCFLLPRPGDEVCEGESRGELQDISRRFKVQINDLAKILFSSEISEVQKIEGKEMTCGRLVDYFKKYVEGINESEMLEITSIGEAHAMAHDRKSKDEVLDGFENHMKKLCEDYQENLLGIHVERKGKALEEFKKKCGFNPSKDYGKLEDYIRNKIDSKMQEYKSTNNLKNAEARTYNYDQMFEAMKGFETVMNEKCSTYMEASMFKNEFDEQERQALEGFESCRKIFGPSFSVYIKQMERDITEKYSVYKKKMEHFKNVAYRAASQAYHKKMDETYKKYQPPTEDEHNHHAAKMAAKDAYKKGNVGLMSLEEEECLKEEMSLKRNECHKMNREKNENAEKKNNAAHDAALVSYRNEMEKDQRYLGSGFKNLHEKARNNAEAKYVATADHGFPSFGDNKKQLLRASDELFEKFKLERSWGTWSKSFMVTVQSVVIPKHLFKSKE